MMKFSFTCILALLFTTLSFAQAPVNDNCSGLIDLGIAPACESVVYTNVGATATNIGFGNIPSCFNGGTVQRDVWFSFTTPPDLTDFTIAVTGTGGSPILNPQLALYRGDCEMDGLAELQCISAPNGQSAILLDVLGLTPNTVYFLRINDYSATAAPNAGNFTICITEYVPAINIGTSPGTTACFGTLYDSGGPDANYGNNENHTFTICPSDVNSCISIEVLSFAMENNFDRLFFHAGPTTAAPLIASLTGAGGGAQPFLIQASSSCVTVRFTSDGSTVQAGFELTWQCSPLACTASVNNPTVIPSVPFTGSFSTCGLPATFAQSPCGPTPFLNGQEAVFVYEAPGGFCASVQVVGANPGTGIIVLDAPPGTPGATCVASSNTGNIGSANFEAAGTYYIVVANAQGCTNFTLNLQQAPCTLSPALTSALCNPLNGCINLNGLPSVFNFAQGFQDIVYTQGVNSGCWFGVGAAQPNFYWFTIEAQAAGPFGFIVQAANPAEASDIDFNVWGPFTNTEVCENPSDVVNTIETSQPIRSSFAGGADPTGLASIHPVTGLPILDEYDCAPDPFGNVDDFVTVIDCQPGEIYVVLVNDWGNGIVSGNISVDWSPSQPDVLAPIAPDVVGTDTVICPGQSVQVGLSGLGTSNITWIDPSGTLSCTDCLTPVATPTETTIYRAVYEAVCYSDTVDVKVFVFELDAGPDLTLCRNASFELQAGSNLPDAVYSWEAPAGVTLSCTDCPNPTITTPDAGTFTISATLVTPLCSFSDELTLTVLNTFAPVYTISDDLVVCEGDQVSLGSNPVQGNTYTWTSPSGFTSSDANPIVEPTENTQYFLSVSNGICPVTTVDSVLISVTPLPIIDVAPDTTICQGQSLLLGLVTPEDDVVYAWSGPDIIADATDPNTLITPQSSGLYTLSATRGICTVEEVVSITTVSIAVDIVQADTIQICVGESVTLNTISNPAGTTVWTPNISLNTNTGDQVISTPQTAVTYTARVTVPGCTRTDMVTILVDSLPSNMPVMPLDSTVCRGAIVVLSSPAYEPADFPDITFQWSPDLGLESADTLYNLVLSAQETTVYRRTTRNGGCEQIDSMTLTVNQVPIISVMPEMPRFCVGGSVQIVVTFSEEVEGFEWTPTDGLSCTDCPNPIASPSSTTTYTLEAEAGECPVSTTITVIVDQEPSMSLIGDRTICVGAPPVQLNQVPAQAGVTYSWTSSADPGFTSDNPALAVSPPSTTTYTLTASNTCATITEQVTISVVQVATLQAPGAQVICAGDELTLTAVGSAPASVPVTYTWVAGGTTLTGATVTFTNLAASTNISLSYAYGADCGTITASIPVTVNPPPGLALPANLEICAGQSLLLNTAPNAATAYIWTGPGLNSNDPSPVVTPTATGTYMVTAASPGCPQVEQEFTIVVVQQPVLTAFDVIVCIGEDAVISASSNAPSGVTESYIWTVDGTTYSGATIMVPNLTTSTTATLAYTYGPGAGCGTLTETVEVSAVTVNFTLALETDVEGEAYEGQTVTVTAIVDPASAAPGLDYEWFVNNVIDATQTTQTFMHIPAVAGNYNYAVTAIDANGCTLSDNLDIEVLEPDSRIPNVFTPNGDGTNDVFRIYHSGAIFVQTFQVFNRWGQMVFESQNNEGWNGRYKDSPAPSDVYLYKVEYRLGGAGSPLIQQSGDVTLIR